MTDLNRRVAALAKSRDRLAGLVETLDEAALDSPSYDSEWSIAQVLSHLGSAAEIFERYLDAGLKGIDAPGMDEVSPIWDEWNGKSQREQAESFIRADRALVDRFEGLGPEDINAFRLDLFGLDMTVAEAKEVLSAHPRLVASAMRKPLPAAILLPRFENDDPLVQDRGEPK